jgi:hypothetical protein
VYPFMAVQRQSTAVFGSSVFTNNEVSTIRVSGWVQEGSFDFVFIPPADAGGTDFSLPKSRDVTRKCGVT